MTDRPKSRRFTTELDTTNVGIVNGKQLVLSYVKGGYRF